MKLTPICMAALLGLGATGVYASSVTLTGTHFDVTYDNAALGLFGAPVSLVDDQLYFFPTTFVAQTDLGIKVSNSTIALKITAKDGFQLSSFGLEEGGDYFYFGSGAAGSHVGVSASGQLRVTPLPGITSANPLSSSSFSANAAYDFTTSNWNASAWAWAPAGTTVANVSIQNILAAYAQRDPDGYAFIEKKDAVLSIGVTAVPEPETWAMLLSGLALVGFLARRRSDSDN